MAWGTLSGVKEWLNIPSSNTSSDTEITNIQSLVNKRLSLRLRKYADPSFFSTALTDELADIENEWVAGVFRTRRSSTDEAKNQPFTEEAEKRLNEFIEAHFKQSFLKTNLKTIKSIIKKRHENTARRTH